MYICEYTNTPTHTSTIVRGNTAIKLKEKWKELKEGYFGSAGEWKMMWYKYILIKIYFKNLFKKSTNTKDVSLSIDEQRKGLLMQKKYIYVSSYRIDSIAHGEAGTFLIHNLK